MVHDQALVPRVVHSLAFVLRVVQGLDFYYSMVFTAKHGPMKGFMVLDGILQCIHVLNDFYICEYVSCS